jgi:FkbM family methyltransferase
MKNFISGSLFKRVYQKITGYPYVISYAQTGEDIIIDFLKEAKGLRNFNYLDIGANHPIKFNNTFKFYEQGYTGVCVEPDPVLHKKLSEARKRDTCLNVGVSDVETEAAEFYVMKDSTLNTFSKKEAESIEANRLGKILQVQKIKLLNINTIIEKYFGSIAPVFVNIDVEGLDEQILRTLDFKRFRPVIFCIETVHYTPDASSGKRKEIMDLMIGNGYEPFADTYINTIFIDKQFQQVTRRD